MRHRWELKQWNNSKKVVGQDESKECKKVRNKAHEFVTDYIAR